ncbi:DUF58 domain-containing protein [Roseiconus nitratireducens]|uniref:DUF58 domain-containing protein n=1 Tax=Roseiconus nitratireducens TaxID=2605748 RepID=A0A5M6D0B1_9BACT|nr:DUF58 domain-containing protein [Roseiconus nitratireducens]KAA5538989.1 DUF58 domain-containing protein [Roseiconus nitratireducens]
MFRLFQRRKAETPIPETRSVSPGYAELVDPQVMDQIGHLELLSRSVVDGLLAGKHRSSTKGGCCEFAQHRQYAPGDEIRQIDWQVYARNDRYFIRQFEEETNLHAMLAVDASGSMQFGLSTPSKLEFAKQAAACLARLLLHQRDAVGLTVLHEERGMFIPAKQHAAHLRAILATLQSARASGAGGLGAQIQHCAARQRRRGLFVLFSDCFGDLQELATALKIVRARGHDVVVMHVLAPEELSFDFRRWSAFESLEVSGQRIQLDPPAVRAQYLQRIGRFLADLEELVVGLGGDYVRLSTASDLADALGWFLRNRSARRGAVHR